jgi:putative phage-type endonuclease
MTLSQSFVKRDLVQGSLTWLDWRRWAVTASDIAAIVGLSPYTTRDQIMQQKVIGTQPKMNFAMQRGQNLEPEARRRFEGVMRKNYPACCVEHCEQSWMRASLDGLSHDNEIVEIKAPSWKVHEMALSGFLPDHYMAQVQWQLLVTGLDLAWFVTISLKRDFVPTQQLASVRVTPNPELQAFLLEEGEKFYTELMAEKLALPPIPLNNDPN